MTRFLHTLHDQKVCPTGVDKLSLQNVKDRGFSVKSMYKGVDVSPAFDFPHRIVWNPVVPPKIGVFAWEAAWGKVLTLDQLKRRGMSEKYGLLPRYACSGIFGEQGICWCLRTRSLLPKELKLILFPICGLGLMCIVVIIHILL